MGKIAGVIVLVFFLTRCREKGTKPEVDHGGSGKFYIYNNSSDTIRAEITTSANLGNLVDTSSKIYPQETVLVLTDAIIGSNVSPTTSLSSLRLFKMDGANLDVVYTQSPIADSAWELRKEFTGNFGLTICIYKYFVEEWVVDPPDLPPAPK